jgi:hypothetical protein
VAKLAIKRRVKFDEAKFFSYLRDNANPTLLHFLRSIDRRACVEMASYIVRYLRRWEEEAVVSERRLRGTKVKRKLAGTISSLRKASAKYRELAAIEIPGSGSLIKAGSSLWPEGTPFLADVLESEAAKLSSHLERARRLYSEKRFGVSGNHLWLVLLQEFVSAWTEQELGRARQLQPDEIADLITAGKVTLGWRDDRSGTDPELISKAILNFRSNPTNAWISGDGAKSFVQERCRWVSEAPFLLGTEI